MEIIHLVLGKANPGRMNGVNKVVDQLASRQVAAGLNAQVWGVTDNPVHDYPKRNYPTFLFKKNRNAFIIPTDLSKAMEKKKGIATFHLHGGFVPLMYAAARTLRKLQIPFVITPHGAYNRIAMERSAFRKKIYFTLFEKALLRGAHRIHSLGKSEVDGLHELYPNNKSMLVPYGFELPSGMMVSSDSNEFIVGFCGRLDVYTKGLKELILGFNSFQASHPNAKLWLIGDSNERTSLEQLVAENGMNDKVVFWGSKYGEEKDTLLMQCSLFAAPSRNEGLPTAVLEAASIGLPCLVTEATNMGEAIRKYDAGKVIAHTEEEQIRKGLEYLFNKMNSVSGRELFSSNARRMVFEEFNWTRIVNEFKMLYAA